METVKLVQEGAIARVTLNRPEKHNAFNQTLIDELTACFHQLDQEPGVRVIVLRGAGSSFSAGADLEWMKAQGKATPAQNRETALKAAGLFITVDECSKPVIAAIQGAALGGGSGLVCAVDIAVASPEAQFGFTEVRWGLVPAVIGPLVIRRLGYSEARYRCVEGGRFDAQEAFRIGMVHQLSEDLDQAVDTTVDSILAGATGAQTATKVLFRQLWERPVSEHLELTTAATATARASSEGQEGQSSFLERRQPRWSSESAAIP